MQTGNVKKADMPSFSLKDIERKMDRFTKSLKGLNRDFTKSLSEMPESALSQINEKALAEKYQDLQEAVGIAEKLDATRLSKRAFWLPWRKTYKKLPSSTRPSQKPAPAPSQRPSYSYYPHENVSSLSLKRTLEWFNKAPEGKEKSAIVAKIQSRKNFLQAQGKRELSLVDLIDQEILRDIIKFSKDLQENRGKELEKNLVKRIVMDPNAGVRDFIQGLQKEYIAYVDKKYLKELRDFQGEVEKALYQNRQNPQVSRGLRLYLIKLIKIQELLHKLQHNFSMEVLRYK